MDAKCKECDSIRDLSKHVKDIDERILNVEKESGELKVEMACFGEMLKEIKDDVKEIKGEKLKEIKDDIKEIKGEKQRRIDVRKSNLIGIFSGVTVTVIAFLIVQAIKIKFNW